MSDTPTDSSDVAFTGGEAYSGAQGIARWLCPEVQQNGGWRSEVDDGGLYTSIRGEDPSSADVAILRRSSKKRPFRGAERGLEILYIQLAVLPGTRSSRSTELAERLLHRLAQSSNAQNVSRSSRR